MQYQRILSRIFLLTLVVFVTWKSDWAVAAVTNAEAAYLKILNVYRNDTPPPDPNTRDRDGNGIVDRAHYRLFDQILANPDAPHYTEITAAYEANLAQVKRDNSGGVVCLFLPSLYGFSCDDFNRYAASLMTIAEPASVDILINELASRMHISFNVNDYNLVMGQYLQGSMDLDGDTVSNAREFSSVCSDFDKYVQAAMDPAQTPSTLPCCGDCPLTIVLQPVGASVYVHGTHSFVVAVDKVETTAHYQWYKDENPVGTDAPELSLPDVQLADAGEYWCRITDGTEEVVSDKALLVVVEHLLIATQPQGADLQPGGSYTLSIALTGGLGTIHYFWFKDEAAIGEDAPQLLLSGLQPENSGTYWCEAADDNERIISEQVQINVVPVEEGEGESEGEMEGTQTEGEGTTEGLAEGTPEEGETEGMQGEGEGVSEGAMEGETEGVQPEGILEGAVEEGEMEGVQPEGEGVSEGVVEGAIEGEGISEGSAEGIAVEGEIEGMTSEGEGAAEGMIEGVFEGSPAEGEGIAEGHAEGMTEGAIEGSPAEGEGIAEGHVEGMVEGAIEGSPAEGEHEGDQHEGEGAVEGYPEGMVEGAIEGSLAEGESEGTQHEGEGLGEGHLEGLNEGAVEGIAVEGESEGTMQEGEGLGEGELTEGEAVEGEGLGEGELTEGEAVEGEGENGVGCFNGDQNNPANWQSLGDLLLSFLTIIFLTFLRQLFLE